MVGKIICLDDTRRMVPCISVIIKKLALQFHAHSMIFGNMLAITCKCEGGKKKGGGGAAFFPVCICCDT